MNVLWILFIYMPFTLHDGFKDFVPFPDSELVYEDYSYLGDEDGQHCSCCDSCDFIDINNSDTYDFRQENQLIKKYPHEILLHRDTVVK